MNRIDRIAWPGLLALVISGSIFAHDPGGYGYPDSGWAGNVTVWGNSMGQSTYAGNLSYGVRYGYAPGHVAWLEQRHGPQCHHGQRHAYEHGYHKSRKHKRKQKGHRH